MESLVERLAMRIKSRDAAAPDAPYEIGRVMAVAAAADPEIVDLVTQQTAKIKTVEENASKADDEKQADADAAADSLK